MTVAERRSEFLKALTRRSKEQHDAWVRMHRNAIRKPNRVSGRPDAK